MNTRLRLMIYDRTCTGSWSPVGLSHSWWLGGHLYQQMKRLDDWRGVSSWSEALIWLEQQTHPIAEIQYWGHGKWGRVYVGNEYLDKNALNPDHDLFPLLDKLRWKMLADYQLISGRTSEKIPHKIQKQTTRKLVEEQPLWWFRTCETFGALAGQEFSRLWSDFFRCRVAGHTYIIGPLQSGLHTLSVGETPQWSAQEGLKIGTPEHPVLARQSGWRQPKTITCLHGKIPPQF